MLLKGAKCGHAAPPHLRRAPNIYLVPRVELIRTQMTTVRDPFSLPVPRALIGSEVCVFFSEKGWTVHGAITRGRFSFGPYREDTRWQPAISACKPRSLWF